MPRNGLFTALADALADAVVRHLKNGATAGPATQRRGKLSAAGRARIRAAQKKRWAEFRRAKKP